MDVNTKYHGLREFEEKDIIVFPKGLPGFEDLRKFILFPSEVGEPFNILHSIEDEEIGFVIVSPFSIDKDYEIKLSEELIQSLGIQNETDVLVVNTMTLSSKVEDITVNMKAPIIINIISGLGEQVILDDDKYMIKHPMIKG